MILETIAAGQIVAHLIGDYVLQSDWMANVKTKRWAPAVAHALTYTLVFLLLTFSWKALLFIFATHLVIDHYRLARYVCWAKNFLAPKWTWHPSGRLITRQPQISDLVRVGDIVELDGEQGTAFRVTETDGKLFMAKAIERWWHPWAECVGTGYHKDRPPWMAVWLMIIADNTLHLLCNAVALHYLA